MCLTAALAYIFFVIFEDFQNARIWPNLNLTKFSSFFPFFFSSPLLPLSFPLGPAAQFDLEPTEPEAANSASPKGP